MKCVLALSFFLAVASAGAIHGIGVLPAAGHVVATPTSSQYHAQDVLGQYAYGYDSPLSSKHEARSFDGITRGGYSYVDGHGLVQSAEYVSDPANGFRVAATNLPVGPGVPAPAVHAAAVAPAVISRAVVAPVAAAVVAPGVAHTALVPGGPAQSSLVTADGIVSHASVGPAVSHSSVVTAHGISSIASDPLAYSHTYTHNYALPYLHRRKRGILSVGHLPASTAPLAHLAVAAPAIHAYAAAPAVSYSHAVVSHAVPYAAAVGPAVAVAPAYAPAVASSRYHAQDALGQYSYGYNDGVSAKQEVRTHDGVTSGAYSYVDPRGVVQSVHYAADGHGFRAAASNIL